MKKDIGTIESILKSHITAFAFCIRPFFVVFLGNELRKRFWIQSEAFQLSTHLMLVSVTEFKNSYFKHKSQKLTTEDCDGKE
jgi:hypothetical protein